MKKDLSIILSKRGSKAVENLKSFEALQTDFIEKSVNLTDLDRQKLRVIREAIKEYKSVRIERDKIESSRAAGTYFQIKLADYKQEVLSMVCLDVKNKVLSYKEIFQGTLNQSIVHPREIFQHAIMTPGTARIMIAHNHPSGDTEPSPADLHFTSRIIQCGDLMGIEVLDHIIVSTFDTRSLRETTNLFD